MCLIILCEIKCVYCETNYHYVFLVLNRMVICGKHLLSCYVCKVDTFYFLVTHTYLALLVPRQVKRPAEKKKKVPDQGF